MSGFYGCQLTVNVTAMSDSIATVALTRVKLLSVLASVEMLEGVTDDLINEAAHGRPASSFTVS